MSTPSYLRVKLLTATSRIPSRITKSSPFYDLYANEDVTIQGGSRKLVSLGILIETPSSCHARVVSKNCLAVKNGISVGSDILESSILLFNHSNEAFVINVGDCIAQMIVELIVTPIPQVSVSEDCLPLLTNAMPSDIICSDR